MRRARRVLQPQARLNDGPTKAPAGRVPAALAQHQPQQRAVDVGAPHGPGDVDVAGAQLGREALAQLVERPTSLVTWMVTPDARPTGVREERLGHRAGGLALRDSASRRRR